MDDPDRDLDERALWDDYAKAFEDALRKCSTEIAPWYVIPANHKWFRDLAVGDIVADVLDGLGYPRRFEHVTPAIRDQVAASLDLVVQVRGQVPGFRVGCPDDEQPAGGPGGAAQGPGEVRGPLQPAAAGQQCAQRRHLPPVHGSIVPPPGPVLAGSGNGRRAGITRYDQGRRTSGDRGPGRHR